MMKYYVVLSKDENTKYIYNRIKEEYQDDITPECIFNEFQILNFKKRKYNENTDEIVLWRDIISIDNLRQASINYWKSFSDYDIIMAEIILKMSTVGIAGAFSAKIPVRNQNDFSKRMNNEDIKNLYTAIAYNLKEEGYTITFEYSGPQESRFLKNIVVSW